MAMAALPVAAQALDPDQIERYLKALEKIADKAETFGIEVAHSAGLTRDEGGLGWFALGIIALAAYTRFRDAWQSWYDQAVILGQHVVPPPPRPLQALLPHPRR